jgi:hypothetical protein
VSGGNGGKIQKKDNIIAIEAIMPIVKIILEPFIFHLNCPAIAVFFSIAQIRVFSFANDPARFEIDILVRFILAL